MSSTLKITTRRTCRCTRNHRAYTALAKCLWPRSWGVTGTGRYACHETMPDGEARIRLVASEDEARAWWAYRQRSDLHRHRVGHCVVMPELG